MLHGLPTLEGHVALPLRPLYPRKNWNTLYLCVNMEELAKWRDRGGRGKGCIGTGPSSGMKESMKEMTTGLDEFKCG